VTTNPTLDVDDYSRELIQETIRPKLADSLDAAFDDPIDRSGSKTPPLVVTALPGGGRVLYPHVVVQEFDDTAGPIDHRQDFAEHDYAVKAIIVGTTSTQMFNLRGLVRGWFLSHRDLLRDAGFAIEGDSAISGSSAEWDPTSETATWELTVTGLTHTTPSD
jgi:hypothetical protein